MGEISYRPLIEDMVWSYSRVECFKDCPYRWFMKYIKKCPESPQFYSSYGAFMHKLLEQFYRGEITREDMKIKFLFDYAKEVRGTRPPGDTVKKYIDDGINYLTQFEPLPYDVVAVEKELKFEIDGIPFTGFIDLLGKSENDLYIVDHKSRLLKTRSGRKAQTAKDKELDNMLKQLYIYAYAIKQEYGDYPKSLCINCFRNGVFIEEPFDEKVCIDTIDSVKRDIENIKNEDDFYPNVEFFSCNYICGFKDDCCYWQAR